jgi:hypothetical protein
MRLANDISKCNGAGCKLRDGCERFVRPAAELQSWANFDATPAPCAYYWPIAPVAA